MLRACRGATILGIPLAVACAPAHLPPRPRLQAPPAALWSDPSTLRSWPPAAPAARSRGHGADRWQVEIRVAPDTLAAYRGLVPGATLPAGARVAAVHRRADGTPGSVYAMRKLAGGEWEFVATGPDGARLRGDVSLCGRCHAEAPADHLFGPPAPGPPPAPE